MPTVYVNAAVYIYFLPYASGSHIRADPRPNGEISTSKYHQVSCIYDFFQSKETIKAHATISFIHVI